MKLHAIPLALIAAVMFMATALSHAEAPPAPWTTDWQQALDKAKAEKKPVIAMFSASWCPPCQQMKANVLPKPEVQKVLTKWVPVYIDSDEQQELSGQYKITSLPTFVMLTSQGEELSRFTGGRPVKDFTRRLEEFEGGLTALERVEAQLKDKPGDAALLKERGDLLADRLNRIEPALASYQEAVKNDPENKTGAAADVYFLEAVKQLSQDKPAAERKLAEIGQQYKTSPRVGDALYLRALLAMQDDNVEQSRALLQKYRQNYPDGKYAEQITALLEDMPKAGTDAAGEPKDAAGEPKPGARESDPTKSDTTATTATR